MEKMSVLINTLSPVIISAEGNISLLTATLHYIPGAMMRGIIAKRYIEEQNLGKKAHLNSDFSRLFFDKLRFGDANPWVKNERAFPLPCSLQKAKGAGKEAPPVQDLLQAKPADVSTGFKSLSGYGILQDETITLTKVQTGLSFHLSRTSPQERLTGSSRDGNIFNYEYLESGQSFGGYILGDKADLWQLKNALRLQDNALNCRLGHSRYAEYGEGEIIFGDIESLIAATESDLKDSSILLRLDSHYIPEPSWQGDAASLLTPVATEMGADFVLEKIYSRPWEGDNFVGVWKMPRPRAYGLAAGTVFRLRKNTSWTAEDLTRLTNMLYRGIGQRREEGFGQLRIWPWRENLELAAKALAPVATSDVFPARLVAMVEKVLASRLLEQIKIYAGEDAASLRTSGDSAHFFARMLTLLDEAQNDKQAKNLPETFRKILQAQGSHRDNLKHDKEKGSTPLEKKLTSVEVQGLPLEDYLLRDKLPYGEPRRSWRQDLAGAKDLMTDLKINPADFDLKSAQYFFAYWHTFFRLARKKVVAVRRES
ncbi:MAG: hypothetical protein IJ849_01700 [Selenomonadaceae bacterium]|nr:hypothetical protein [Selenomonadaceae bacterium]